MKETIKAGIGGYAFTFDIDAYEILNSYLENLKRYFQNKADGEEIIADIESRMSELLQLKIKSPNNIITSSDAGHIIEIMGNPVDFVDDEDIPEDNVNPPNKKKETPRFEKKLYRDTDHSVIGGVCSGLGQYFRLDPVIIRVAYVLSIILVHNISHRLSGIILLSYFVLWIVMPKAKTIVEKLAMSGQDPSIENIEAGSLKYKEMRGGGLSKIVSRGLRIFGGIILYLVGIAILLSAFFAIFFPTAIDFPGVKDFLEANDLYSNDILIAGAIIWCIPAFMLIYFAVRLMIRITGRDLLILGFAFLIWLGACSYLGIIGVRFAKDYKSEASYNEKLTFNIESDTIHLQLDDLYNVAESTFNSKTLYMIDGTHKSWFMVPPIEIKKDSIYKNIEIDIRKKAFAKSQKKADEKARNANLEIREQSSNIIIKPHLYNKNNLWDREVFYITIYCPEDKTIIIDNLLEKNITRNNLSIKASKDQTIQVEETVNETDSI